LWTRLQFNGFKLSFQAGIGVNACRSLSVKRCAGRFLPRVFFIGCQRKWRSKRAYQ
jgi:hypothetical protein